MMILTQHLSKLFSFLFSFFALPCFNKCHRIKRFRFSCFRCAERRALSGKLDLTKNHYCKALKKWIPNKNRELAMLLFEDWTICYILYVDEQRRFRAIKDVLVNKLFKMAEKADNEGKTAKRAKLLSLTEFLAS